MISARSLSDRLAGARVRLDRRSMSRTARTARSGWKRLDGSSDELVDQLQRLRAGATSSDDGDDPGPARSSPALQSGRSPRATRRRRRPRPGPAAARGPGAARPLRAAAELGVGSFGYVFRAWDPQLERVVALKVQRAGSFASHEEVQRFLREARSAAQLKHPAIVSLYETGQTEDGVWFLVCEYIDGATLEAAADRRAARSGARPPSIAAELAEALQYAHEHGVDPPRHQAVEHHPRSAASSRT